MARLGGDGGVLLAVCAFAAFFLVTAPGFVHGARSLLGNYNLGDSCGDPLDDCDYFFQGHENDVPEIHLRRRGDHMYRNTGVIMKKDGYDYKPVAVANSYACALGTGEGDDGYSRLECEHRLYASGEYISSREFNIGNPNDFLGTCIKILISSAMFEDGGNFNGGRNDGDACIMVRTKSSFC